MLNLYKVRRSLNRKVKKHLPNIMTGVGIVGMAGAGYWAVKVTPKYQKVKEKKKKKLKTIAKYYGPPIALGAASAGLICGGSAIHTRRNAMLLSAYTASVEALKDYHTEVLKEVGDQKSDKIDRKLVDKKINERGTIETVDNKENIKMPGHYIETGLGTDPFYDVMSDRLFLCDMHAILSGRDHFNADLNNRSMWGSLNEFWATYNMPPCELGKAVGFNTSNLADPRFEVRMINGRPTGCLYFPEYAEPTADYYK